MTIHLLEDSLINKIAAGEVIERPASVVRELVDNAVDAGSTRIRVAIERGGHDSITVDDDGQGIPAGEISLAFMRHATSKLTSETDLFAISTMGFRGEALPSIAAVSRVEVQTACQDGHGHKAVIEGGRWLVDEAIPCPRGTRIQVRDLFFNTPARKKFMKSAGSESGRISLLVSSLALARPDIAFEFRNEKNLFFKTPGDGRLYNAMLAIYGRDYCQHFIEIRYQSENLAVEGFIGKPDFKRLNRRSQVFFVNQRLIESPMLARALDEGYRGRLISREYPAAIIKLQVPPPDVDVNIHPQKREVKFQDDSLIFRALQSVIKARLASDAEGLRDISYRYSAPAEGANASPGQVQVRENRPLESVTSPGLFRPGTGPLQAEAWRREVNRIADRFMPPVNHGEAPQTEERAHRVLCQLNQRYIVLESGDGLLLVDQHAAHERIMFERLRSRRTGESDIQGLLIPLQYELTPERFDYVMGHIEKFQALGFEIEAFGENSVVIRSLPPFIRNLDLNTLDDITEIVQNDREDEYRNQVFALLACKSAIKSGDELTYKAMEKLVDELFALEEAFTCPHGRPTVIKIDLAELDRRFKRVQ